MKKKRVSNSDLSWIVMNELEKEGCPRGTMFGIVPDSQVGWRVVIAARSRPFFRPSALRRVETVEKRLRDVYQLAT